MEMRYKILSRVGAQNMETRGYQVSNLEDIEFHWDDPHLNMDTAFQSDIDTSFPLQLAKFLK